MGEELKISYLTIWVASFDNLTKRTKKEVDFLIKLFDSQFKKMLNDKEIEKNKVRIQVHGRFREILPANTIKLIDKLIKKTEKFNRYFLTFLLAYSGVDEMVEGINNMLKVFKTKIETVNAETIKKFLWTKDLPPVDLIIRTGCENDPHNSAGFMMWHTPYSQYYFTSTLLPDFTSREFEAAVNDFSQRERRFGK